jgi:aryl-alcohol dehydrogenase-like predicted oxidoreductase
VRLAVPEDADTSEANGWSRFVSMQNHLNLIYREEEREMLPLCREEGIGVIPWSPLARGRLTRDWDETTPAPRPTSSARRSMPRPARRQSRWSRRSAKVAKGGASRWRRWRLAWVLQKPGITAPIIGASKMGHLDDAVAALSVKLTAEEIAELEDAYVPHAVVGFK